MGPPDAVMVNRRWIPQATVDWVKDANEIMVEHGAVLGRRIYPARHQARWRARKLIDHLVDLGIRERWELQEHTYKRDGGWVWTVEYRGGSNDR
jgi:hypothetical protein